MTEEIEPLCSDTQSWFGLYPKGRARDDAFYSRESIKHPAKMSLPLLRAIISEMMSRGELKTGDVLADPFGGRGSTAIEWCRLHPKNWAITCELEAPFVRMQSECKAIAETTLGRPLLWSIVHGDSRKMDEYINALSASISSPPYGETVIGSCSPKSAERLRALTKDPASSLFGRNPEGAWFDAMSDGYGKSSGQIGGLKDDADYAALGSPPYESSLASGDPDVKGGLFRDPKRRNDSSLTANYVNAVGSPPFEAQSGGHPISATGPLSDPALHARHAASKINKATSYGHTQGQIGTKQGESYGSACREVYSALWRSGCKHVTLVTKNPVKNQQLRRLDLLTVALMRDAGYELTWARRAYLWETTLQLEQRGVYYPRPERPTCKTDEHFWGRWHDRPVGEMSFFNMLHILKNRRPPAQFEDVLGFKRID